MLQTKAIDKAMCADVAKLMVDFQQTHTSMPYPEAEGLEFYQLAHAFALIQHRRRPHEPLPDDELRLVEDQPAVSRRVSCYRRERQPARRGLRGAKQPSPTCRGCWQR